jgi:hypothetical protein
MTAPVVNDDGMTLHHEAHLFKSANYDMQDFVRQLLFYDS